LVEKVLVHALHAMGRLFCVCRKRGAPHDARKPDDVTSDDATLDASQLLLVTPYTP